MAASQICTTVGLKKNQPNVSLSQNSFSPRNLQCGSQRAQRFDLATRSCSRQNVKALDFRLDRDKPGGGGGGSGGANGVRCFLMTSCRRHCTERL